MQFLLPVPAALLGWVFARVAIRWYTRPEKLGILLIRNNNTEWLTREIFPSEDIKSLLTHPDNFQRIRPHIEGHIDRFLKVKLAEKMPMISMFIGDNTIRQLKAVFMEELEQLFPQVMVEYTATLTNGDGISEFLNTKLKALEPETLGRLMQPLITPLIRKVELCGAAMGFLIGILQLALAALTV